MFIGALERERERDKSMSVFTSSTLMLIAFKKFSSGKKKKRTEWLGKFVTVVSSKLCFGIKEYINTACKSRTSTNYLPDEATMTFSICLG